MLALWRATQDRLRAGKNSRRRRHPLYASDIDGGFVELARRSALAARVERYIHFATCPVQQVEAPADRGVIVANLPYGCKDGGTTR
jgi:23S rRNA (guanine2445-N2)-methyltransferase / 23S rRNA (guanine2069-N7)-methyltransferase